MDLPGHPGKDMSSGQGSGSAPEHLSVCKEEAPAIETPPVAEEAAPAPELPPVPKEEACTPECPLQAEKMHCRAFFSSTLKTSLLLEPDLAPLSTESDPAPVYTVSEPVLVTQFRLHSPT